MQNAKNTTLFSFPKTNRPEYETLTARKAQNWRTHRGECVACVGNQHAGLPDGAVPDRNALYKPRRAHLLPPISPNYHEKPRISLLFASSTATNHKSPPKAPAFPVHYLRNPPRDQEEEEKDTRKPRIGRLKNPNPI